MPKILYPSQQYDLQQRIARKSIREYQTKIKSALQKDFDKAAVMVEELGASQVANFRKSFFNSTDISNILRTLYEGTGGYTGMRYQKIFDSYKKEESIDINTDSISDFWLAFMLSYWTAISGLKMYGIENTTNNEIIRLLNEAINQGRKDGLSQKEIDNLAIQLLREGKINNARSLLIARTESHQALSTGAMGATQTINIPLLKQWVHSEYIGKPRIWHKDLDRQTNPDDGGSRILVNQPFLVNTPDLGVIEMQYAHDASGGAINNCNCRCCTVYIA